MLKMRRFGLIAALALASFGAAPQNVFVFAESEDAFPCTSDANCSDQVNDFSICSFASNGTGIPGGKESDEGTCQVKPLFEPFIARDYITTIGILIMGLAAAGGGIGGGGLFVPFFVICGWGKDATVRSLAVTTGLSLAMLIAVAPKRHPTADRPLVDYEMLLMFQPITLLGTVPGKILNKVFPTLLVYICLIVLLIAVNWRTYKKYRSLLAEQRKEEMKKAKTVEMVDVVISGKENIDGEGADGDHLAIENIQATAEESFLGHPSDEADEAQNAKRVRSATEDEEKPTQEEADALLESEKKQPYAVIACIIACWVGVFCISIVTKEAVDCGSGSYWALTASYVPVLLIPTVFQGIRLMRAERRKQLLVAAGFYTRAKGDITWSASNTRFFPLLFVFAGLLSSLLGIGGGMVIAPLLLELNMAPAVSSASTAVMTLFTASSAAIQFLISDTSTWDYFVWYACFGFVAGYVGRVVIQRQIAKTGKQATVVFVLLIATGGAMVMMSYVSIDKFVADIQNNVPFEFASLCAVIG